MDARKIRVQEVVPASRKLAREEAAGLARQSSRIVVAKGGKVTEFPGGRASDEVIEEATEGNPIAVVHALSRALERIAQKVSADADLLYTTATNESGF